MRVPLVLGFLQHRQSAVRHASRPGPAALVTTRFEPFISHGKQKGTGLGLTVVNNVMQQHGGDAVVEQTGPGGTTFRLHFPAQPGRAR